MKTVDCIEDLMYQIYEYHKIGNGYLKQGKLYAVCTFIVYFLSLYEHDTTIHGSCCHKS